MSIGDTFCTFRVAGRLYGVEARWVQEVLGPKEITPLPLAPPTVRGLIHVRGQFLTAIDLSRALGVATRVIPTISIVVRSEERAWAFLVDAVEDIIVVDPETLELVPGTVAPPVRGFLHGAFPLERELLMALNVTQLLRLGETQEPATAGGSEAR